ncbi:MAG: site-specific integrase [Bacillota bacterium]|nr:site-specific integrase [Bacillota bacterium]
MRDYALILLTLDTGIRPGEALALLPHDVNFSALEMRIRAEIAKTRISRTLPIHPITANTIKELLSARPKEWQSNAPVFCSNEGKKMNITSWGDRLEMYSKEIGVHIRPYDLRHVFALVSTQWWRSVFPAADIGP